MRKIILAVLMGLPLQARAQWSQADYMAGRCTAVISQSGIDLSTVTTALAGKCDRDVPAQINLSTVTTALGLKVDRGAPSQVNLSTVTTALGLKVDRDTPAQVNLSTITTALALKQASFVGISSVACSGYIDGSVYVNGVVTGGVCTSPQAGSEGNTYTSSKTFTSQVLIGSTVAASAYCVRGSSVPKLSGVLKTMTTGYQAFYTLAQDISGLSFALAANTSYYFEFDINHRSSATATGVWFGATYPTGSTITWTVIQSITLATASTFMSRGGEFTSASGATVDAINGTVPARLFGTISTKTAGNLQLRIKSELSGGRGDTVAGSSGRLMEQ